MGRLPVGGMTPYVLTSIGGEREPKRFYCTTYCSSYGIEGFKPRRGQHTGTGYTASMRPALYYNSILDQHDNKTLGLCLADVFSSTTHSHFLPLQNFNGTETLPQHGHAQGSGFTQLSGLTVPRQNSTLLQTEYKGRITASMPTSPEFVQHKIVGPKKPSGFSKGSNMEPITFQPRGVGYIAESVPGRSIMKADFLPFNIMQCRDAFPAVAARSLRETGFIRDNVASLPSQSSHARQDCCRPCNSNHFLCRIPESAKQPSGFTENMAGFVSQAPKLRASDYFLTNYNLRFSNTSPAGLKLEGWTHGGIQRQMPNGYTVNNELHYMVNKRTAGSSGLMHPHQARTVKKTE
ncbi:protein phosphatase 1 regulatory subunit 32 [Polypterus senegalus]|uniref:protein phosphatase 1 regulatory subunit 32 n=1 Tax=Polypterus senegalus TaxID=55291 RepID=UPI0019666A71|nr:protein phosphatase 1 regulatory subunit 32 [Polypterus senegalus]